MGNIIKYRQYHDSCEDCWYSCPLSVDGCCDDSVPQDVCRCGADKINAYLDKLEEALQQLDIDTIEKLKNINLTR